MAYDTLPRFYNHTWNDWVGNEPDVAWNKLRDDGNRIGVVHDIGYAFDDL